MTDSCGVTSHLLARLTPDNSTFKTNSNAPQPLPYPTPQPIICSLPQGTGPGIRLAWAQQLPESPALLSLPPPRLYNSTKGKQLSQQAQWPGREETAAEITSVSNGDLQSFSVPQKHQLIIRHSLPPQICMHFLLIFERTYSEAVNSKMLISSHSLPQQDPGL